MPRSHGIIHVAVWEVGSGFRANTLDAQWAYEMLISQPAINNLGLLPYTPEKWWRFAADLTVERLQEALTALEDDRMTITDPSTGELLVRTFIKHDGIWKHSKLVMNARKLIREVESERIRDYILDRHPWLLDDGWNQSKIEGHETGKKPLRRPAAKPQTEPQQEGVSTGESTPQPDGETEPQTEPQHDGEQEGEPDGEHDGQYSARPRARRAQDGLGLGQGQDRSTGSTVTETRAVAAPVGTALAQITPELRGI